MTKKIRNRIFCALLAIFSVFTMIPSISAVAAENYNGGWAMIKNTTTVVNSNGSVVGSVYALEGITVLRVSGNTAYIEYSVSGSPKRGYVNTSNFYREEISNTCVAKVTTSSTTYYSNNTSLAAGSVSAGEYLVVLAKEGSWVYVEYNTSDGKRKRAYMPYANISCYNRPSVFPDFYQTSSTYIQHMSVGSQTKVYGGPSRLYAGIGYADPGDDITIYDRWFVNSGNDAMLYVSYPVGSQIKYGYIFVSDYF